MTAPWLAIAVGLAGCGRINFDPLGGPEDGGLVVPDAGPPPALACNTPVAVEPVPDDNGLTTGSLPNAKRHVSVAAIAEGLSVLWPDPALQLRSAFIDLRPDPVTAATQAVAAGNDLDGVAHVACPSFLLVGTSNFEPLGTTLGGEILLGEGTVPIATRPSGFQLANLESSTSGFIALGATGADAAVIGHDRVTGNVSAIRRCAAGSRTGIPGLTVTLADTLAIGATRAGWVIVASSSEGGQDCTIVRTNASFGVTDSTGVLADICTDANVFFDRLTSRTHVALTRNLTGETLAYTVVDGVLGPETTLVDLQFAGRIATTGDRRWMVALAQGTNVLGAFTALGDERPVQLATLGAVPIDYRLFEIVERDGHVYAVWISVAPSSQLHVMRLCAP